MIELQDKEWRRLYAEVLLLARRMTYTKKTAQQATQRDRADEATQRAFNRFLRVRPADLDTVEEVRKYLVEAVRSELSNATQEQASRRAHEASAAVEQATVGATSHPCGGGHPLGGLRRETPS